MCDISFGFISSSQTSSRQRLFSEFFYLKACEESEAGIVLAGKVGRYLKSNLQSFAWDGGFVVVPFCGVCEGFNRLWCGLYDWYS